MARKKSDNGSDTFVRITNQDIYTEIQNLSKSIVMWKRITMVNAASIPLIFALIYVILSKP